MCLAPTIHDSGNGNAVNTLLWHLREALVIQILHGKSGRSPSAGIEAVKLVCPGIPVEQEQVASEPVHHWLGNAQHGVGGYRRIHGGSAARKYLNPSLRGDGT